MNTLTALKRSPLGLDLYLWAVYRTFGLVAPMALSWPMLYRQFGVDPSRADDNVTVQRFRRDCLRELKKIQTAWPGVPHRTRPPARKARRIGSAAVHAGDPGHHRRLDKPNSQANHPFPTRQWPFRAGLDSRYALSHARGTRLNLLCSTGLC